MLYKYFTAPSHVEGAVNFDPTADGPELSACDPDPDSCRHVFFVGRLCFTN